MVPQLTQSALTLEAGNGHLFALPWRGHTLLATTDSAFTGDPGSVAVTEDDIDSFLAIFGKYLPGAQLSRDKVEFFYAGLRPLVSDGSKDSYNVSRRAELIDHGKEGWGDGLYSALGGKYTTSRSLAEKVTNALCAKLEKKVLGCTTFKNPLPGGRFDQFDDMVRGYQKTWPGLAVMRHLAHMLGARLPLALKGARLTDLIPLNASGDTPAQIDFALREEMAITLEDVVMRRTGIGQFGKPSAHVLEKVANQAAAHLGWNNHRKAAEIASLDSIYQART